MATITNNKFFTGPGGEARRLLGSSAFIFACRLSGAVLAFGTQVILARWLGAAELGICVSTFAIFIVLATVGGLGYPSAMLRFVGKADAHEDMGSIVGIRRRACQVVLASSIIVAAVGLAGIMYLGDGFSSVYNRALGISLVFVPLYAFARLNNLTSHAFAWFGLAFLPDSVIRPLLYLIALVAVWWIQGDMTAEVAVLVQMLVIVAVTAGQQLIIRRRLAAELGSARPVYDDGEWLRTALPLVVISLFTAYFAEVAVIVAGFKLSSDQVAIFNASYRVALLINFGLMAVDAVTRPQAARLYAKGDISGLQHLVGRATIIKVLGALAAVVFLGFLGEHILLLFGEEFTSGYQMLMILAGSQLLTALLGPGPLLLTVTGHQSHCLPVFALSLVALLGLNLGLVPLMGPEGAAVAVLLVVMIWTLWLHAVVVRKIGVYPSIAGVLKSIRVAEARKR